LRFSVGRVADVEERNNYRQFGGDNKGSGRSLGSLGDLMSKKFPGLAATAKASPKAPPSAPSKPMEAKPREPVAQQAGIRRRDK
jgi:hypothetical protein